MTQETTYSDQQAQDRLTRELPQWELGERAITRAYKTTGWPHTLMLVNAIGYVAEAAFHHPDLEVTWPQVRVTLSTHSAKGITDKDFELAAKIEETATWLPGGGGLLAGIERETGKDWTK